MVERKIDFGRIEKKWQKKWEEKKIFEVKEGKGKKFYVLEMFPYPSSSGLHLGHALNYTIGDIYARFKKMKGFNVLHPMGFDSFGLPAENAAIKAKSHPKKFTEDAIKNYIKQMKGLGLSYDWSRMVETHKPDYYRWDQWIFLKMFEKGLVYRKKSSVNWCSKCNTVLANEQVIGGRCWRHEDTNVEVKSLEQWFLRITNYADELYEGIKKLDGWPETIKTLQKNWIGKSYGTEIDFKVGGKRWPIFTTRADTLFGVTFMVISAQHPNLIEIVTDKHKKDVERFLKKIKSTKQEDMDKLEKEGVFTGSYAEHPLTGEKIPIWAGNFVIADYGIGMVMAVPAHDQRDFEFAKKYKIPIKLVVQNEKGGLNESNLSWAYESYGILVNSDKFNGLKSYDAIEHIGDELKIKKLGKRVINYRLRDWLISRQRFWGTPIPIIYCDRCGMVPVPEKDLPVVLPDIKLVGEGNPLEKDDKFLNVKCPKCGINARRETDTMDTFVNSSWYYLRYCDSKNNKEIFDKNKVKYWCPVDMYIGGKEHACLHLIYIRFYTKFLRDVGLLDFDEPSEVLFNQGMLLGENGEKMSKSKGNVILPEVVSKKYGLDTARLFLVSVASPDKDIEWNSSGVEGSLRFIKRLFEFIGKVRIGKSSKKVEHKVNSSIRKIEMDIEILQYNFAVIKLRKLFEFLEGEGKMSRKDLESFVKLLSPFCPHVAEELWEKIGGKGFVSLAEWSEVDEKKIDEKFEKGEEIVEKTILDISNILRILGNGERVYLYVIPSEVEYYDAEELSRKVGKKVAVFAVNDKNKYDPEGKSGRAKPGKPGIFVE